MNENINLVNILKDAPRGTILWSPLCGECEFRGILSPNNVFQIRVKYVEDENNTVQYLFFSSQGKYCYCSEAECMLFPSKENRDWSTFKAPWSHKYFEPYQKVLVAACVSKLWEPDIYGYYDDKHKRHICMSRPAYDNDIIPYKGNEDKVGKPVE